MGIKKVLSASATAAMAVTLLGGYSMANADEQPAQTTEISQEEIAKHFANQKSFADQNVGQPAVENYGGGASTQELFAPSRVEDISIQEGVASPDIIGTCRTNAGATACSISEERTVSASIHSEVSVGFDKVNAALGGSYAESISKTWQCTGSPTGNTQLEMHSSGIFVQFTYVTRLAGVETGRYPGSAFIPTGVDCQIANI